MQVPDFAKRRPAAPVFAAPADPLAGDDGRITRTQQLTIVGVTAVVWLLNSHLIVLRPLLWLTTFVHEAMHALAGMVLGQAVHSVTINPRGGGLAYMSGNRSTFVAVVVSSAGYVGAAIVGAIALELCSRLRSARVACLTIAGLVATVGLLWVPWRFSPDGGAAALTGSSSGDGRFTVLFCVLTTLAFVGLAVQPSRTARRIVVLVVATALCLLAIDDLKSVLDWSAAGGHSDAAAAAAVTPLSSWMWSAIWLLFGIVACVAGLWSVVIGRAERQ